MIHIVTPENQHQFRDAMEQAYRLRHRVFVEEMGWEELRQADGREIEEWTRYCVEPAHRERGRALSPVANALLAGIVEWGMESGVSTIIIEMNPLWLLRLVQLYFRTTPLGLPKRLGSQDVLAVTASFDHRTLARLQEMRGDQEPVLAERIRRPAKLAG